MAKKTKGIQVNSNLHAALLNEKIALTMRTKNPNVTFQEVLEDVFIRAALFDYLMIELSEKHAETRGWVDELLQQDFYGAEFRQYVNKLMEEPEGSMHAAASSKSLFKTVKTTRQESKET